MTSSRLGVPEPSTRTYYLILGTWPVCVGARTIYCMVRSMASGSTWPGLHGREVVGWSAAVFLVIVVTGLGDPAGESFWSWSAILWMTLRPPFVFTRAGAARRRAEYEATFCSDVGRPQPPA